MIANPVLSDTQILGIDISKSWFDVFLRSAATKERFDNTSAGFSKLIRWLRSASVEIAVMEATGGLEMPSHLPAGVLPPTVEEAAAMLIRLGLA